MCKKVAESPGLNFPFFFIYLFIYFYLFILFYLFIFFLWSVSECPNQISLSLPEGHWGQSILERVLPHVHFSSRL